MASTRPRSFPSGDALEARVQRLFMCQGAFAERGLLVRAFPNRSKIATDIDVVAHDYSINFHHRRIYAECKGGKTSTLDRAIWVRGMMSVLGAESAYLVLNRCDEDSVSFARGLGIDILQADGLEALEDALSINATFWPGRSNLRAYCALEEQLKAEMKSGTKSVCLEWLHRASLVWREASALTFSYGRLNALLEMLRSVSSFGGTELLADQLRCLRYAIAALQVRLCQYVVFVAADTLGMTRTDRQSYVGRRLTVGSLGLGEHHRILQSALNLAKAKLAEHGITDPSGWKVEHLLSPPRYARPFSEVVERVIASGHRAVLLPLAMEIRLFGYGGDKGGDGQLLQRVGTAMDLTGLIRGLVTQSLGISESLTGGVTDIEDVNFVATSEQSSGGGSQELFG